LAVRVEARVEAYNDALLEILCYTHPAVDPETGHLICHHHTLGAAVIEAGGHHIPALLIGGCAYLIQGPQHTAKTLEAAEPTTLQALTPETAHTTGETTGDPYWLTQALRAAAELRAHASLYTLQVDGTPWTAVHIKAQDLEALILTPPTCTEDHYKKKSQTFYQ